MEFDSTNDIEMWDWRQEDFSLQNDSELVPQSLWNDMSQNDDSLLYAWGEHTPVKDIGNFGCDLHFGDNSSKGLEESRGSQSKRRRMLQYPPEVNETHISTEQTTFASESSKELENSLLADEILECLDWNPEWTSSYSDNTSTFGKEGFDQSSEGWLASCLTETEIHQCSGETSSCLNDSVSSDDHVEISKSIKMPSQMESAKVRETPPKPSVCRIFRESIKMPSQMESAKVRETPPKPSVCRIFRGRKSSMNTPTKLTTAVAYPFSLVKPGEDQGGVTLKDINQRLHAPPLSKSKQEKDEAPYPTSAFSGKPVVVKTKIITEGGRGSITITRTKG